MRIELWINVLMVIGILAVIATLYGFGAAGLAALASFGVLMACVSAETHKETP